MLVFSIFMLLMIFVFTFSISFHTLNAMFVSLVFLPHGFCLTSRSLLEGSDMFQVPEVIDELSGSRVLAMELVQGVPLDRCVDLDQETRNQVRIDWRGTGSRHVVLWWPRETGRFYNDYDSCTNRAEFPWFSDILIAVMLWVLFYLYKCFITSRSQGWQTSLK